MLYLSSYVSCQSVNISAAAWAIVEQTVEPCKIFVEQANHIFSETIHSVSNMLRSMSIPKKKPIRCYCKGIKKLNYTNLFSFLLKNLTNRKYY